jgi:uncharacterized protein YndB with AHSA1/START domain
MPPATAYDRDLIRNEVVTYCKEHQGMQPISSDLVVRRSTHIKAAPDRVWREFESFERMAGWWDAALDTLQVKLLTYEPRVGGPFAIEGKHGAFPYRFDCTIVTFELAREFTVDWNFPAMGWQAPAQITVRLSDALGGRIVETLLHGFERTGPAAIDSYLGFERGWQAQELIGLKARVEGA